MTTRDRRGFLKAGATLGTTFIASPASSASPAAQGGARSADTRLGRRTLGTWKHSLQVSSLGLGCMGMSYHRSFIPERKVSLSLIRKAVDLGVTLFDTAEAYRPLTNEGVVGEALQPVRKDVVICSKFGFDIQNGRLAGLNSKPPHIRAVAHLRENLASADFEFTTEELRGFTEAVSKIKIVGERYTGTQAQQTNR